MTYFKRYLAWLFYHVGPSWAIVIGTLSISFVTALLLTWILSYWIDYF